MSVTTVPVLNYTRRLERLADDAEFVQQHYGTIKSALSALCDKEDRTDMFYTREVQECRRLIQEADAAQGNNPVLNAKVVKIYARHFGDFQDGFDPNSAPVDQGVKQALEAYGRHGTSAFFYLFDAPTQYNNENPSDRAQAAQDAVDAIQQTRAYLKFTGMQRLAAHPDALKFITAYLVNKFPNPSVPVSLPPPVRTSPLSPSLVRSDQQVRRGSTELPPDRRPQLVSLDPHDRDQEFEPLAGQRETELAAKCKNPTDEFVQSPKFVDVYAEMVDLFENETDSPAFLKLKEELTPSVFAFARENRFVKIDDVLRHVPVDSLGSVSHAMAKMIAQAYHRYRQIKADEQVKALEKTREAELNRQRALFMRQYHQAKKNKAQFAGFIDHLDKLQKKGGYTDAQVTHMRGQLYQAVRANHPAITAMKKAMTTLGNDTAVVRTLRLVDSQNRKNFTVPFSSYSDADKQLIIRAYKIYMREKASATYYPEPQDMAEVRKVNELGKEERETSPLQAKRELRRTSATQQATSLHSQRQGSRSRSPSPFRDEEELDTSLLRRTHTRQQSDRRELPAKKKSDAPSVVQQEQREELGGRQHIRRTPTLYSSTYAPQQRRQSPPPLTREREVVSGQLSPKRKPPSPTQQRVQQEDRQRIPYKRQGIYSSTYTGRTKPLDSPTIVHHHSDTHYTIQRKKKDTDQQ